MGWEGPGGLLPSASETPAGQGEARADPGGALRVGCEHPDAQGHGGRARP